MKTYTKEELEEIIEKHRLYLTGEAGGEQANLRYSDLRYSDLSGCELSGCDLRCSNLSDADLRYANLSDADLRYVRAGNNREVRTLQLGRYEVTVSRDIICIGCKSHSPTEWLSFSDQEILVMDGKNGLKWWKEWKGFIFQVHATIN